MIETRQENSCQCSFGLNGLSSKASNVKNRLDTASPRKTREMKRLPIPSLTHRTTTLKYTSWWIQLSNFAIVSVVLRTKAISAPGNCGRKGFLNSLRRARATKYLTNVSRKVYEVIPMLERFGARVEPIQMQNPLKWITWKTFKCIRNDWCNLKSVGSFCKWNKQKKIWQTCKRVLCLERNGTSRRLGTAHDFL